MLPYLEEADEIWHAGDIGNIKVLDRLQETGTVWAVYGNIDDAAVRSECPEYLVRDFGEKRILMIHIAGPLGRYNPHVRELIATHRPDILICGHSHILKVQFDQRFQLLYVNPGATGHHGFHLMRTMITFEIGETGLKNMQAIELGRRGRL